MYTTTVTANQTADGENGCFNMDWLKNPKWPAGSDWTDAYGLCDLTDDDLRQKTKSFITDTSMIPVIIVYTIIFVFGIITNCMIIQALTCDRKVSSNNNVTNQFLVSLAIADVLFLLICGPYDVFFKYTTLLAQKNWVCKTSAIVEMLTTSASIWNLTAVSIERYIVIVHPIQARISITRSKGIRIIFAVWMVSLIMTIPTYFMWQMKAYILYNRNIFDVAYTCEYFSEKPWLLIYEWYKVSVLYIVPILIMAFCYFSAIKVLWRSTKSTLGIVKSNRAQEYSVSVKENGTTVVALKNLNEYGNSNQSDGTCSSRDVEAVTGRVQVIRMLIVIILLFLACWGPKLINDLYQAHGGIFMLFDPKIKYAIYVLPFCQSALNPVIYFTMSRRIRKSIIHSCRTCSCTSPRSTHPSRNTNMTCSHVQTGRSTFRGVHYCPTVTMTSSEELHNYN